MEETLISFDVAKLLKEKGFDWNVTNVFETHFLGGRECYKFEQEFDPANYNADENYGENIYYYSRPTQSLAQKWLREVHKSHILIYTNSENEGDEPENWIYTYTIKYNNSLHDDAFNCIASTVFNTYEEALDACLLAVLQVIN